MRVDQAPAGSRLSHPRAVTGAGEPLHRAFGTMVALIVGAGAAGVAAVLVPARACGDRTAAAVLTLLTVAVALLGARTAVRTVHRVAGPLRDAGTAKDDFVSTVSHELRTPLTSISGYLELLREDTGALTGAQLGMLDVIDRNARRLEDLIEDLLLLSRVESGSLRGARRPVDLAAVLSQASAAVAPAAGRASVALHTDVRGPLPVRADPDQLDKVLMNLLGNAVKFTPADGAVRLTGRRDGDETVITVSDTGMGIPHDEQSELFDRFFRASNAVRDAVPGAGLGLAIARTIVDNHGGRIEVRSAEGAGTSVTVRLPVEH